jgi:hypothetical protein
MTLNELAEKTPGLDGEAMAKNLQAAGIEVPSQDVVLGDLAKRAGMTPMQLYAIATGQIADPGAGGGGRGANRQGQQGGGYGMGRLTLRQYCQQQGLDLEKTMQKLREKGFSSQPDMTVREIAATGGVHPSAMRDILAQ